MSTDAIADSITAASSISSSSSSSSTISGISIDTETFLTLLVAQLTYQDPLEPQTDTEFITQLAQMSTLEEMQGISSNMESIQAYSLVGKYAYAEVTDSDTGTTSYYYGTIDSIVNDSGTYYAIMDDDAIEVGNIIQIFDSSLLDADSTIVDSSSLIGKTVTGTYEDDEGTAVNVSGVVTSVECDEDLLYVTIDDDTQLAIDDITSISDTDDAGGTTDASE